MRSPASIPFKFLSLFLWIQKSSAQSEDTSSPTATSPTNPPSSSPSSGTGLTVCQQSIVQQLTNVFENSRFPFAFDYCQNIEDGRGFTSGIIGFTTATHDALQVIQLYRASTANGTEFDSILNALIRIDQQGTSSTNGLGDYCSIWASTAANRGEFRSAQIQIMDEMYFKPSQKLAEELGLKSPLARGQIYDSFIQHGNGTDYDSALSMVSRTKSAMTARGLPATPALGASEDTWLTQYLAVRTATLTNASTPETRKAWAESVTRVKSYSYALSKNQLYFENSLIALSNDGKEITVPCKEDLWVDYVPWEGEVGAEQLSAGAIVGIVLACLVVATGTAYIVWRFWWIKRKGKEGFSPVANTQSI